MPVTRDRYGRFVSGEPYVSGVVNQLDFRLAGRSVDNEASAPTLRPFYKAIKELPPLGLSIDIQLYGGAMNTPEFLVIVSNQYGNDDGYAHTIIGLAKELIPRPTGASFVRVMGNSDDICRVCMEHICEGHLTPKSQCHCCRWLYDRSKLDENAICENCRALLPTIGGDFSQVPIGKCEACHTLSASVQPVDDRELPHRPTTLMCVNCRDNMNYTLLRPAGYRDRPYSAIQGYSTKKAMPTFLPKLDPSWLYMGVELETDTYPDENQFLAANEIRTKFPLFLTKSDASLTQGVEIVSEPATLTHHKTKMGWTDIQNIVRKYGGVSHKSFHCGLHVHVNKNYFGVPDSYQWTRRVRKIASLCYRFRDELFIFSRRARNLGSNPVDYTGITTLEPTHDEIIRSKDGRYGLNLMPPNTIEFRYFRGTLRASTFFATLEFVDLLCHIGKFKKFSWVRDCSWADIVALADNPRYQFLLDYFKERGIDK